MSSFFTLPGAAYLLALPAVLLLALLDPDGPIMSQKEAGWSLVIYLWLIICGFVVVSNSHLQASIQQQRWISLALALVSSGIGGYLVLSQGDMAYGTPLYAILFGLRGFCSWCWVLAFLGLGMRYLNFRQPFLDFANEAVLPFYILHQTILLGVGYFVVQWNAPDLLRWVVILVLSFIIIMVLYEYLIRRFNLLRVLFGMKALPRRSSVQSIEPGLKEAV